MGYSEVKTKINNQIKTNGNQEITGAILNDVLNDMLDYSEEGGGVSVSQNTSTGGYDLEIGTDSYNIPSGEDVFGNIAIKDCYLNADGTLTEAVGYGVSDFIEVQPNTTYVWRSGCRFGWNGKLVQYGSNKSTIRTYVSDGNSVILTGIQFTTRADTNYIRFTFATDEYAFQPFIKQGDTVIWTRRFTDLYRLDNLEKETSENTENISKLDVLSYGNILKKGYYINSDGNEVANPDYGVTDFIPTTIPLGTYSWYSGADSPYSLIRLVFYNKDKQRIASTAQGSPYSLYGYQCAIYYRLSIYLEADSAWVQVGEDKIWECNKGEIPLLKDRVSVVEDYTNPNIEVGYYLNASGEKVANENYGLSDFIPVTSSTQYVFNAEQPAGRLGKIIVYSSNKTTIRTYWSDYGVPYSVTTPSDSAYIRMPVGLGDKVAYLKQGNTIIWSRYYKTKEQVNKNTFRIDALENYNDNYSNLGTTIDTAIKEYRNRVSRAVKDFALNFGFVTDVHLTSSGAIQHLKRLYTMAKYSKSSPAKFLLFGGDLVSGENTVALDMTTMLNGKEAFKDNFALDCLMVRGNHDGSHKNWKSIVDGGGHPTYDDEINNQDWYNMMVSSLDDIVIDQSNPMGGYFYKDYPNEKIRLIVLNCYDMTGTDANGNAYNAMYSRASIRQAQATWLATKALDFSSKGDDKSNWGIVVTSHDGVDLDNSAFGDGDKVELMLQAFKKGERYEWTYSYNSDTNYYVSIVADFREQGAMHYYAFIHGHTHTDRVIFQDGVPHISSGAAHPDDTEDMPSGATLPLPRTVGEVSEYLWDTASVGKDMVCMFRFGAVESGKTSGDRYIHLGANEVAVNGTITLTPTKVSGTLTWGIYSVSTGYYVPIVNGVAGTPVGTPTNHASISNGVVTGLSVGDATAFAQDEAGNKEFFGIVVIE